MGENSQPNLESDVMFKESIAVSVPKIWFWKKVSVLVSKKSLSIILEKFGLKKVSVVVSKIFGLEKKSHYWYQKYLVSKKVSVSVSKTFSLKKKSRYRSRKYLV